MRKFKMYVEEVSNDGSEFELVFKIDDKIVDLKTEYCIEDCLIDSYEFFRKNCEKYNFDSRNDGIEVDLKFRMGM
jgi:hypothetical protein